MNRAKEIWIKILKWAGVIAAACVVLFIIGRVGVRFAESASQSINGIAGADGFYGGGMANSATSNKGSGFFAGDSYDVDYDYNSPSEPESEGNSEVTSGRKLIRKAGMSVDTLDYDAYMARFDEILSETGAYTEHSYLSLYGRNEERRLTVTIRVPDKNLEVLLARLPEGGSVKSQSLDVSDVTLQYTDIEAHRDMLKEEQAWLLSALGDSTDLEQLLMVRDRLTNVNYELESLERQLRSMDSQIDYATVEFTLTEVQRITQEPEGIWGRIVKGVKENFEDVRDFIVDFIVWTFSNVFTFLLLVAIGGIGFLIVRFTIRRRKKKKEKQKALEEQSDDSDT